MLNLQKMFEVQRLQNYSVFKKNKDSVFFLQEEVLGFLIKLSELSNKTRGFGEIDKKLPFSIEGLLETYIEGFYYIFSIGNYLGINSSFVFFKYTVIDNIKAESILEVYGKAIYFNESPSVFRYIDLFTMYLGLAEAFNFTQDDIEKAYLKKYI
ncbi:dUTP diphosphatase [Bacillus cereus]